MSETENPPTAIVTDVRVNNTPSATRACSYGNKENPYGVHKGKHLGHRICDIFVGENAEIKQKCFLTFLERFERLRAAKKNIKLLRWSLFRPIRDTGNRSPDGQPSDADVHI